MRGSQIGKRRFGSIIVMNISAECSSEKSTHFLKGDDMGPIEYRQKRYGLHVKKHHDMHADWRVRHAGNNGKMGQFWKGLISRHYFLLLKTLPNYIRLGAFLVLCNAIALSRSRHLYRMDYGTCDADKKLAESLALSASMYRYITPGKIDRDLLYMQ